ncbi:prepilin peptidase [Pseudomonas syringae]|uniref:Prepilin type IV endopeptidase peptidase domain-containing protein n=1 Tax=Pseudomonas syringae TaxID=317 RepID=A0A085V8Z5_PSESX|nr:prepilin peptidase [Pseudomonas syringae]KFE51908.1 hypothetical protein IV01_22550 [Pseudomonas syringae]
MELITLIAWLAMCAIQDARQRQISNVLTIGAIVLALMYLLMTGETWLGAAASEGGVALLLSLLLTLPGYLLGKLGAGDLKLLAALALATDRLFLLGTFIGAGVAILLWFFIRQKFFTPNNQGLTQPDIHTNVRETNKHPFAPFLLAGFLMTLLAFHPS